ncbi:hypothetical protein D3C85_1726370 [compost metagenome]
MSSIATRITGWSFSHCSSVSVSCSLRSVSSRSLPALQRLKILARMAEVCLSRVAFTISISTLSSWRRAKPKPMASCLPKLAMRRRGRWPRLSW